MCINRILFDLIIFITEMARDSAVGRERILVVPGSLTLDNSTTNQHVVSVRNDLNQQILEVSQFLLDTQQQTSYMYVYVCESMR